MLITKNNYELLTFTVEILVKSTLGSFIQVEFRSPKQINHVTNLFKVPNSCLLLQGAHRQHSACASYSECSSNVFFHLITFDILNHHIKQKHTKL